MSQLAMVGGRSTVACAELGTATSSRRDEGECKIERARVRKGVEMEKSNLPRCVFCACTPCPPRVDDVDVLYADEGHAEAECMRMRSGSSWLLVRPIAHPSWPNASNARSDA